RGSLRSSVVAEGVRAWTRAAGAIGAWIVGIALVPAIAQLAIPESEMDCWTYHLAVPWQFLQAHKSLLDHVPVAFHHALPVELTFAPALVAGDDRLAKGLMVLCFAAGAATWAAAGVRGAGVWLGALVALGTGWVEPELVHCKSDMAAAALLVAGAAFSRRGAWGVALPLLGASIAAKVVYAPVALLWLAVQRPPARQWSRVVAWLVLPSLSWAVKAWLATGHPASQFVLPTILPAYDWGALNRAVFDNFSRGLWPPDTTTLWSVPGALLGRWRREHLTLLLLVPGMFLLAGGRARASVVALIVAQMVTLGVGHLSRYLMASAWLLAQVAGAETFRLPGWCRRWGIGLLVAVTLARIGVGTEARTAPWPDILRAWASADSRGAPGLEAAAGWLTARGARRVLLVAEERTYRIPGRVVYAGCNGETPLLWEAAKESADETWLRARVRQWGTEWLLHNYAGYVNENWMAFNNLPFAWDDRQLALYRGWARGYLERQTGLEGGESAFGRFCLYRIRPRPLSPRPATAWFLPGAESLDGYAVILEQTQRLPELLAACRETLRRTPDVGHAWNLAGHAYALLRDYPRAYAHLRRFAAEGMVDVYNLSDLGAAALGAGRLDEAARALAAALEHRPERPGFIRLNLALVHARRGRLAEAERELALVPVNDPDSSLAEARRGVAASLASLRSATPRMGPRMFP
ncbi:MAG: tetratricopeptide repeat protein, partial [bacterium]